MCRNCGAIVGAGQANCTMCGAVAGAGEQVPAPAGAPDRDALRFARAVLNRSNKFTIALLIANFFVFLLMWNSSGMTSQSLWGLPETVLIAFGAKLNYLIREQHQWWRFITPMFVHVNLPHLLVNMYSLWIVGPYVEKLYGSAKFSMFWVVTGICGVVASYYTVVPGSVPFGAIGRFLFRPEDVPSAGASGALFGLVGVLFVFGIKFRHELPEGFKRAFGTGLLPIILINLFIGYLGRGFIDNAAHLGGLLSGAVLALFVGYRRPGERAGVAIVWRVLQAGAILLIAFSFAKTAQHLRDPLPPQILHSAPVAPDLKSENFLSYAKALNEAQDAFVAALKDNDLSNLAKAVQQLEAAPTLDPEADELRGGLKQLLINARVLLQGTSPAARETKAFQAQQGKLAEDFRAWSKRYNQWLKTTARTHSGLAAEPEPSPTAQ